MSWFVHTIQYGIRAKSKRSWVQDPAKALWIKIVAVYIDPMYKVWWSINARGVIIHIPPFLNGSSFWVNCLVHAIQRKFRSLQLQRLVPMDLPSNTNRREESRMGRSKGYRSDWSTQPEPNKGHMWRAIDRTEQRHPCVALTAAESKVQKSTRCYF